MAESSKIIYEAPKVESTVAVEALMTWGGKKKRRDRGGGSNHS